MLTVREVARTDRVATPKARVATDCMIEELWGLLDEDLIVGVAKRTRRILAFIRQAGARPRIDGPRRAFSPAPQGGCSFISRTHHPRPRLGPREAKRRLLASPPGAQPPLWPRPSLGPSSRPDSGGSSSSSTPGRRRSTTTVTPPRARSSSPGRSRPLPTPSARPSSPRRRAASRRRPTSSARSTRSARRSPHGCAWARPDRLGARGRGLLRLLNEPPPAAVGAAGGAATAAPLLPLHAAAREALAAPSGAADAGSPEDYSDKDLDAAVVAEAPGPGGAAAPA
jgi:hypothetical protein